MDAGFKLLLPYGGGTVVEAPVRAALRAGLDPVVVVTGHRGDEVRRALEDRFGPPAAGPRAPGPAGGATAARRDGGTPAAAASRGRRPGGDLRVVFNPRFPEGLATSIARGILEIRTATEAEAAALLLGDEPGVGAGAVREVVDAWRRRTALPVVRARYRDRPGHPVVFPRDVFPALEGLEGDRGARGWMERNPGRVEEVRLDRAAPTDVDTDEDYGRALGREGT